MKFKMKYLLPLALAVFLPLLGLLTNSEESGFISSGFIAKWLYSSLVLYFLWYIIAYLFDRDKFRYLYVGVAVVLFTTFVNLIFSLVIFKSSDVIVWINVFRMMLASVLFIILQYALHTNVKIAKLTVEKEQIQAENYRAQLQELRQKVDPHFLFNSMNTLRTMIRHQHPQSEEYVLNLSGFYRQTLKFNNSSIVSLQEELEVLKSYLFLMQIRNEGKVIVDINVYNSWGNYQIPTMSLQIIAENCFKHNQASASHPLRISIFSTDDFYIAVRNNLQPKLTKSSTSGYGLENIRKRYDLLGVKQGMIIEHTSDYFEVKLKLI